MHHDLSKTSKGLISMALMTERISIIRKALKMGIKLAKYDRSINVTAIYQTDSDAQTKRILDKSRKLLEKIRSRKIKN